LKWPFNPPKQIWESIQNEDRTTRINNLIFLSAFAVPGIVGMILAYPNLASGLAFLYTFVALAIFLVRVLKKDNAAGTPMTE
jgi:hypothetical protein